jgi:hypothetical protein
VQVFPVPHAALLVHWHLPETHIPLAQSQFHVQVSAWQLPVTAPTQVAAVSEQSDVFEQLCVVHVPGIGGVQVDVTPQSVSALQELPVTNASADT